VTEPGRLHGVSSPVRILTSLAGVDPGAWDRLGGNDDPFLSHAFLHALQQHGCLEPYGWTPRFVSLWSAGNELMGAVPLYLKSNSYGEFVFDWDWAEAWERAGLPYYPKGVVGIPYTPATGRRLLLADPDDEATATRLITAVGELATQLGLSSVHWNFTDAVDSARLERAGLLPRRGCQYHWQRRGESDFDDLLAAFSSVKRKKIRQERRKAAAAGLTIVTLHGDEARPADWAAFHAMYVELFDRKWGTPTLSEDFFAAIGRQLGRRVLLIQARDGDRVVANALCLVGSTTLYGRHWGCIEQHPGLHFELCYYHGLEYCLAHGLQRFEPGAQGEHKIARGFLPSLTHSAHWIADPRFRVAVSDFVASEARAIDRQIELLTTHSPYRREAGDTL